MNERGPDIWAAVDRRFRELLDLDEGARAAALERLRATEPEVAREVAHLLESAARAEGDFERSLLELPSHALQGAAGDEAEELPGGGVVDRYRLVETVGRGGLGTVYRAERVDGAYAGSVALKVLRRGLDTDDLLARFRVERQILASLHHPHIARLYDGGSLDDGRPYLVMEYVEGRPIDEYCRHLGCTLEERLDLFLQVCEAVAHAHRALVLHRDIKPSNILVDEEGSVRLLDFGIAKLLEPGALEGEIPTPTRTGSLLFTPQYAAPEQLRGESPSVATDVYQLGVLLCRLLTGRSPYDLEEGASPGTLHRAIEEGLVRAPSRIVEEAGPDAERPARARALRGDLDTIVLTALQSEADRRYRTVDALAADLRRHRNGYPIAARPASVGYRIGRFVRRNPAPVAASAAAALLLVALAAVSVAFAMSSRDQARALAEERDRVEQEAERAEAVSTFLVDLFGSTDPREDRADTMTARTLLDRGRERAADLPVEHETTRPRMLGAIGSAYERMGVFASAVSTLEEARRSEGWAGLEPEERVELLSDLAGARRASHHFEAATERYEEALGEVRAAGLEGTGLHANLLAGYGMTLRDLNLPDSALGVIRESLAIREDLPAASDEETLGVEAQLAYALRGAGEYDEAEELYRRVLEGEERMGGPRSSTLNNLAYLLVQRGRAEEAVPLYRDAVAILDREVGPAHDETRTARGNLAGALVRLARFQEAEEVARERLEAVRAEHGGDNWRVGASLSGLATVLQTEGRVDEAMEKRRATLEIYEADLGPDHSWTAGARTRLAGLQVDQGDYQAAETQLLRARQDLDTGRSQDELNRFRTLEKLVELYERWDRPEDARPVRQEIDRILESPSLTLRDYLASREEDDR